MLETEKTKKTSTGMVLQRSIFDILNRLYSVVRGELFGLNTFSPIKLGRSDLEKSSNVIKRQEVSINSDLSIRSELLVIVPIPRQRSKLPNLLLPNSILNVNDCRS